MLYYMDLNRLIKCLENGECPPELNFRGDKEDVIDWDKVRYNTFFKSNEFFENKFPDVVHSLPAFDNESSSVYPYFLPISRAGVFLL